MRIPAENDKLIAWIGCDFAHIYSFEKGLFANSEFLGKIESTTGEFIADFEIQPVSIDTLTDGIMVRLSNIKTVGIDQGTYRFGIVETQQERTLIYPFINGTIEFRTTAAV